MKAGQKLLIKTLLMTIGSLCRIGGYYYRRFMRKDPCQIGGRRTPLAERKTGTPTRWGFSGISMFWDFMRDDMPGSKLPTLATLVLSIVVNTATCERYFSELTLIHTAK